MNIDTALATHQGNRKENQDRATALISDSLVLLAVADGMGGHANGAEAAQTAINTLVQHFKSLRGRKSNHQFLIDALDAANHDVTRLGHALPFTQRPRTTCTVCIIDDNIAQWAHIGDSRVYWLRNNIVLARTRDHSEVEALVQAGQLSDAEIMTHPRRNLVARCLGGDDNTAHYEIAAPVELKVGDQIMLCTDGLWNALPENQLSHQLASDFPLETALTRMVNHAAHTKAPYSDNVSAAALRCSND